MYKIAKIGAAIFGVIGVLLCFWVILTSGDIVATKEPNTAMNTMFGINYALLFISLLIIVFAVAVSMMASPKSLKNSLLLVGAFLVLLIVSYALSFVMLGSDSQYQWVSTGIVACYLLIFVSIILIIRALIKESLSK